MTQARPMMALRDATKGDTDVDRYIKESLKSYKDCNVKNNARRNSLQRKTLGIESERRLTSVQLSREERQLREQLKQMNIEKAKNHIIHNLREPKKKTVVKEKAEEHYIPTEPYPVTFRHHDSPRHDGHRHDKYHGHHDHHGNNDHFEHAGEKYARKCRRRVSREFEDLNLNTQSGQLYHIHETDELDSPRRRVNSMSTAQRILGRSKQPGHLSTSSSPRHSPSLRRKVLMKGGNSSSSSKESMNGSSEKITSLDDLRWVGEPEAIHSVRRARKTVEEQELEAEIHRLAVS